MATEAYVPVTGDDWYQRRRQDAEGEFFRSVANQGPRTGEGGSTRQGIYMFTADGELLAYRNAGQAPDVMRDVLREGLERWRALPEARQRPGAVRVEPRGEVDERYARTPPEGGLIVTVYTRLLDREADGSFCDAACESGGGDEAAMDHLWLTEDEWRSLIPERLRPSRTPLPPRGRGQGEGAESFPVPRAIVERIARFHLVDNTRGEPPMWGRQELRAAEMTLTVEEATAARVVLRLEGNVRLSTALSRPRGRGMGGEGDRGFDSHLLGYIGYDAARDAIDRFDIVAVGDHWGEGTYTRGARPGRTPLGVAFELAAGDSPADRVPPQAARDVHGYFGG